MIILNYEFTETQKIKTLLSQIKKQEKQLNALSITHELFQKIFKHNYLRQAYSSTKIEYSLIDYNSAQKVLYSKKAENEEEREILNVANAHMAISKYLKKRFSDDLIIDIHKQISEELKGSLTEPDYRAGRYRNIKNYLGDPFTDQVSYTFPEPQKVPELMKKLNYFANNNGALGKLLIPGIFHFVFIAIHPFINGNGRTVRVLEDMLLKKAGYNLQNLYNLSEYYYANVKRYHFALNRGRDQKNLTEFAEFYLEGVAESQKKVFTSKLLIERLIRLHALPEWKSMDKFDKKTLNYLAKNNEITIRKALKLTSKKFTSEAVRLRFQKYVELGIMKKEGDYKIAKYVWI